MLPAWEGKSGWEGGQGSEMNMQEEERVGS